MRPQTEIDSLLNQAIGQYAGQRVDYYGYAGECLSLVKRWVDVVRNGHLNGPMTAPPSPDGWGSGYWSHTPGSISELFIPQSYDPNATYPAGSLFVNTVTHHIGVMVNNNPGQPSATVFHQNANPDGSPAHTSQRSKTAINGILVLKVAAPPPPPAPVPIGPPYWVEPITAKQVKTNKSPTMKWGMNYDNLEAMGAHPIAQLGLGTVMTVVARVHHNNGMTYYKTDLNDPDGYNIADCDDYVPAPPAPPVIAKPVEKYTLIKNMMFFNNALDAKNKANYAGDLLAGEYIVWSKEDNSYNLTDDNRYNQNKWVNINDNKPDVIPVERDTVKTLPTDAPAPDITIPVDVSDNSIPIPELEHLPPTAPKPQYGWIRDDKLPVRLTSTNTAPVPIHDLEGKWPKQMLPGKQTEEYSMFAVVGNKEYWLIDRLRTRGWYYGVDIAFLPDEPQPTLLDKNGNGKYDIIDIFSNGVSGFEDFSNRYFTGLKQAVTTVTPKIQPAVKRIQRSIDGITRKAK